MKRTPLRRRTPMPARSAPIRKRASRPARRPYGYEDPAYLAWLRTQACRVFCCFEYHTEAHHLRHDAQGRALGAKVKDDRRAISICHAHHVHEFHGNAGVFKGWSKARLRAWEDEQLRVQRGQYLAQMTSEPAHATVTT